MWTIRPARDAPAIHLQFLSQKFSRVRCGGRVWKETVKHTLSSRFHIDVSKVLRELNVAHDFEYVTEDGLFSLDIALRGPRGPVAIEVDGPYHFTLNTRQPLGSTLIRCTLPAPCPKSEKKRYRHADRASACYDRGGCLACEHHAAAILLLT